MITKQHVITAAHCITGLRSQDIRVLLGANAHDVFPTFRSFKIMSLSRIDIHPNYIEFPHSSINDFAILTFTHALKHFTLRMKPVCLPSIKLKGKRCNTMFTSFLIEGKPSEKLKRYWRIWVDTIFFQRLPS